VNSKKLIDRRLFRNMPRRLAKKYITRVTKLNFGLDLKSGDLVSTCKGFNERIAKIIPCWGGGGRLRRGRYIYNFEIITECGHSCSLIHCCTVPTETREAINQYWVELSEVYPENEWIQRVAEIIHSGEQAFDEDGQPMKEFCSEHDRKIRFKL